MVPMKNHLLALLLCLSLASLAGCASTGGGSTAQKLDQLAGVWIQYDATPKTDADKANAIQGALDVVGVALPSLDDVVPSATGILLVQKLVESHPELAPYSDLLEKLYTIAVYGVPSPPAPAAGATP